MILINKKSPFKAIISPITNSIRGLARRAETINLVLTSVDALSCIALEQFTWSLMRIIMINFSPFYYIAKNRCRLLTVPCF